MKSRSNPFVEKIGPTEVHFNSKDGIRFHLKKGKGHWLVSWEPHQFNARKFARKQDAIGFIQEKLKMEIKTTSNPTLLSIVNKQNPDKSMGIKRKYDPLDEVGEDIKELVVKLYKDGDSIERIARRVDLNITLVRGILAEANVPVRVSRANKNKVKNNPLEGGSSKEAISKNISKLIREGRPRNQSIAIALRKAGVSKKSNPRISNIHQMVADTIDALVASYENLVKFEFGTEKFNHILTPILWGQGLLLNWYDNAVVTMLMINRLYDIKTPYGEMKPLLLSVMRNVLNEYQKVNSYVASFDAKSCGYRVKELFDENNNKSGYFCFMQEREGKFFSDFFKSTTEFALIDYCNLFRYWVYLFPEKSHDDFNKCLVKNIVAAQSDDMLHNCLIMANDYVKDCYTDALPLVAASRQFIEEVSSGEGDDN